MSDPIREALEYMATLKQAGMLVPDAPDPDAALSRLGSARVRMVRVEGAELYTEEEYESLGAMRDAEAWRRVLVVDLDAGGEDAGLPKGARAHSAANSAVGADDSAPPASGWTAEPPTEPGWAWWRCDKYPDPDRNGPVRFSMANGKVFATTHGRFGVWGGFVESCGAGFRWLPLRPPEGQG